MFDVAHEVEHREGSVMFCNMTQKSHFGSGCVLWPDMTNKGHFISSVCTATVGQNINILAYCCCTYARNFTSRTSWPKNLENDFVGKRHETLPTVQTRESGPSTWKWLIDAYADLFVQLLSIHCPSSPFIVKALCELRKSNLLLLLFFWTLRVGRVRELIQGSRKLSSNPLKNLVPGYDPQWSLEVQRMTRARILIFLPTGRRCI